MNHLLFRLIFSIAIFFSVSQVFSANQYMHIPNNETYFDVELGYSMDTGTIEMWVNFDNPPAYNGIFRNGGMEFAAQWGIVTLKIETLATYFNIGYLGMQDWHHVAFAWEQIDDSPDKIVSLYFDGVLKAKDTVKNWSPPSQLGMSGPVTTNRAKYKLDEFRIWNTARSLDELNENKFKPISASNADLKTYINFDEGTGNDALKDLTSNNTAITLHNGSFDILEGFPYMTPLTLKARWQSASSNYISLKWQKEGDQKSAEFEFSDTVDFSRIVKTFNTTYPDGNHYISLDKSKTHFVRFKKVDSNGNKSEYSQAFLLPASRNDAGYALKTGGLLYNPISLQEHLDYSQDFTIATWLTPSSNSRYYLGSGGFSLYMYTDKLYIQDVQDTDGYRKFETLGIFNTKLPANQMYHLAVRHSAFDNSYTMFVNGETSETLTLSKQATGKDSLFIIDDGNTYDDYRVWNSALSEKAIQQCMYNSYTNTTGLISNLEFNESNGDQTYNSATDTIIRFEKKPEFVVSEARRLLIKPTTNISSEGFSVNWVTINAMENINLSCAVDRDFNNEIFNKAILQNTGTQYIKESLIENQYYYIKLEAEIPGAGILSTIDSVKIQPTTASKKFYVKQIFFGNSDGSSWEHAFPKLKNALEVAQSGDTIIMAAGVYKPGSNATDKFEINSGITILGGFDGTSYDLTDRDTEKYRTIISGDITEDDVSTVFGVTDSVIGTNNKTLFNINYDHSNITIDGIIFTGAQEFALFAYGGKDIIVSNSKFIGNSGSAVALGYSSILIENCELTRNYSNDRGAGINVENGSYNDTIKVVNCMFEKNIAKSGGGAIFYNSDATMRVHNSTFRGDTSAIKESVIIIGDGHNVGMSLFDNCVFKANAYLNGGGPPFASRNSTFNNCLFIDNVYSNFLSSTVQNSLFYNTSIDTSFGAGNFSHNLLPFECRGGNITGDPQFVDVINEDYRLQATSPCIDAGTEKLDLNVFQHTDFYGNNRFANCRTDIGIHETPNSIVGLSISKQPEDRTECLGMDAMYTCAVEGSVSEYLWKMNNVVIPNSNNDTLLINNVDYSMSSATIQCFAIGSCDDTLKSAEVKLYVTKPIEILKWANPISQTICYGDNVTVSLTSGLYSYEWSDGQTGSTVSFTEDGTYVATLTDGNGCSYTDTTEITVWDLPQVVLDEKQGCTNAAVRLAAGTGYPIYVWSNGEETESIILDKTSESGLYSVEVTDENGCVNSSNTIEVAIYDFPTPTIFGDTVCEGTDVILKTIEQYSSYTWSNDSITPTITLNQVSESGDYTVTVVDNNGCVGASNQTSVLVLENPEANAGTDFDALYEVETNLSGAVTVQTDIYDVYWSPGNLLVDSTDLETSLTLTQSEVFTLTVIDDNNCSGSNTVTVNILGGPLSVSIPSTQTHYCKKDTALIEALGSGGADPDNYQYTWVALPNNDTVSESSTAKFAVTHTGWYKVYLTDGHLIATDSVLIIAYELPEVSISPASVCEGEFIKMNAPDGFESYEWSNGIKAQQMYVDKVSESGLYTLTVTDANTCKGVTEPVALTIYRSPNPEFTDTTVCFGNPLVLTTDKVYSSYAWSDGTTGDELQLITPEQSGEYSVTVTDKNGCIGNSNTTIVTINETPTIALPQDTTVTLDAQLTYQIDSDLTSTLLWNIPIVQIDESSYKTLKLREDTEVTVEVTNEFTCSATDRQQVKVIVPHYPVEAIDIPDDITIVIGETIKLNPIIMPLNASNKGYELKSNDESLVSIVDSNTVKAETLGSTQLVILMDDNGKFKFVNIHVVEVPIAVESVEIQKEVIFTLGETVRIHYSFEPSDATNQSIDWNTSNDKITITDNGLITALEPGTAKIFAYVEEIDELQTINVTIHPSYPPQISPLPHISAYLGTGTVSLNVNAFIDDDNTSPIDIKWSFGENELFEITEEYGKFDIAITDLTWEGEDSILVTATDIDGFIDMQYLQIAISQEPNKAPLIDPLPAIASRLGVPFDQLDLFNYLSDDYTPTVDLEIHVESSTTFDVSVKDFVLNVNPKKTIWFGTDSVLVIVTDKDGASALQYVVYSVGIDENTAPEISEIPVQKQDEELFQPITLNQYVTDDYTLVENIYWKASPSSKIRLDINENNIAKVVVLDESWVGYETVNLIASDAEGLSDTTSVVFAQLQSREWYEKPFISFSPKRPITGVGVPIEIDANLIGAQSWKWDFPGGECEDITALQPQVIYNTPGVYSVKLWAGNSIGEDSLLMENSIEVVGFKEESQTICRNSEFDISIANTSLEYVWSTGESTNSISVLPETDTTIYVTITDDLFTYYDSITLTLAHELTLRQDTSICAGDSVLLEANGFESYLWNNGSADASIYAKAQTQYTLTATDVLGCESSASFSIDSVFAKPSLDLGSDAELCLGTDITLDAGTEFDSYKWSVDSDLSHITLSDPGEYSLTVTDSNNCSAIDTFILTVLTPYEEQLGVVTVSEFNENVLVTWERTSGQRTIAYEVYRAEVIDGVEKWQRIDSIPFTQTSIVVDTEANFDKRAYRYALVTIDDCKNRSEYSEAHTSMHLQIDTETGNNQAQLFWTSYKGIDVPAYIIYEVLSDGSLDSVDYVLGDANSYNVLDYDNTKTYRVGIMLPDEVDPSKLKRDSGPFSQSMSNLSEAIIESSAVQVNDLNVEVYPNPTTGLLTIYSNDFSNENVQFTITSMTTSIVSTFSVNMANGHVLIDLKEIPAGVYYLTIEDENNRTIEQIVKQ